MAFYNGNGELIAIEGVTGDMGITIVEHNLFDELGGIYLDNYTTNAHSLKASEGNHVVYAKLTAGNSYLFAFNKQAIIHILNALPDVEAWKKKDITEWVYYGWTQNYFPNKYTEEGTYIITPETDIYVIAGVEKTNKLYVWDAALTGDINPGGSMGSSGFSTWNQNDNSYSAYPFSTMLEEMEDVEVTEEFKKGVIHSTDINRIYSGNIPVIWVGDSIVYAASNVGLNNSYRYNVARSLDLPWDYHAQSGATITDGYGISWDSADATKTGYSGFIATESGDSKAETPKEKYSQAKLVVFAMGTNDFGNHAPLGTAADTGTDTFYGAFRNWLNYFQSYKPDMPIIVVTPFKRDTWAKANNQNLILPDYVRAMYRVARDFKHVYLLDVFSKWYGDTDNEVIRARNSIDGIHPSAWFHDCLTTDLIQKIKEVCALEGIR